MTPHRPPTPDQDLIDRFKRSLIESKRKLEQLELAYQPFSDDEDGPQAFREAWDSEDPEVRNRAELLHANFERVHQLLIDLIDFGSKLAERRGHLDTPAKNETRIQGLVQAKVLGSEDEQMLTEHVDVRNEGQHAYIEQVPFRVWEAAKRQIQQAPAVINRLLTWFDQVVEADQASAES